VDIDEVLLQEVLVDGVGGGTPKAQHCADSVGARAQMRQRAKKLERVCLLLQRVSLRGMVEMGERDSEGSQSQQMQSTSTTKEF
jgi:hypothetical protein